MPPPPAMMAPVSTHLPLDMPLPPFDITRADAPPRRLSRHAAAAAFFRRFRLPRRACRDALSALAIIDAADDYFTLMLSLFRLTLPSPPRGAMLMPLLRH
jgi:hypothetical protein